MIVFIYGTRPEAIKIGPVVAACRDRGMSVHILCTGQHTTLLQGTPAETDLKESSSLGLKSGGDPFEWARRAAGLIGQRLADQEVDVVVVQGDTMSALAGALAAHELGLTLAHVEAGVRSHNPSDPWPEELIRIQVGVLADWHYAPTSEAFANLLAEGVPSRRIRLTGNPVVSALARYAEPLPDEQHKRIVVTMHRREIQNERAARAVRLGVARAATAAPSWQFLWPVHPGFARFMPDDVALPENAKLVKPMPYRTFVRTVATASGVLTDSGGLVEECATLGVPCAIMRRSNDRPEAVAAGIAKMFEPTADGFVEASQAIINGRIKREKLPLYGYPGAADEIARHLEVLL